MTDILKAEFHKLKGNKLLYGLIFCAFLHFLLAALVFSNLGILDFGGDGSFSLWRYIPSSLVTLSLNIPVLAFMFPLIINSFVSEELNSDRIIYQVVGKGGKKKVYGAKMLLGLSLSTLYLILSAIFIAIAYYAFLVPAGVAGVSNDTYFVKLLVFFVFYFFCIQLISLSLSFIGFEKGQVILMFLLAFVTNNLAQNKDLYAYFPGSIVGNFLEKNPNMDSIMMNQYIVLTFITFVFVYIGRNKFLRKEF